jgi:hypothetical protein
MGTWLQKTIKYVDESFGEKKRHFERTLYWLIQLRPDADEALQIAAYAHDIQRAFVEDDMPDTIKNSPGGFKDKELMANHQNDGGEMMKKFLLDNGADQSLAERVDYLISKHEVGGDKDQDLLKDADSVSYFETNVDHFIEKAVPEFGYEKVRDKFDWMFNRITSKRAKEIAKPMYDDSIKMLELTGK